MLTLETLLTPAERSKFNDLVEQATNEGAQAVRWHSQTSGVLVVGICAGGELLTWFAAAANSATEAEVAQRVILAGLAQASASMAALQLDAGELAATAIAKAAGMH